jgi:spore cortex-lytic enzyme
LKKKIFKYAVYFTVFSIALIIFSFKIPTVIEAISKYGSKGEEVTQIQKKLKNWGYYFGEVDGIFGSRTQNAVKLFQQRNGLAVDGIAGLQTLRAMGISTSASTSTSSNKVSSIPIKYGSRGNDVKTVQSKLKNWGYYSGGIDGVFGSETKKALVSFQKKNGLTADGIVGSKTLSALGLSTSGATSTGQNSTSSNNEYLLARIISAEARGEPYSGQVAVGAVVLNRVDHPSFPNTIAGVIYQKGAFTALDDGQFDQPIADSAYRAAREALAGSDPTGGCIYYYNPATATNAWIRTLPITTRIGKHVFSLGK